MVLPAGLESATPCLIAGLLLIEFRQQDSEVILALRKCHWQASNLQNPVSKTGMSAVPSQRLVGTLVETNTGAPDRI